MHIEYCRDFPRKKQSTAREANKNMCNIKFYNSRRKQNCNLLYINCSERVTSFCYTSVFLFDVIHPIFDWLFLVARNFTEFL